jgi:hypothetical protein
MVAQEGDFCNKRRGGARPKFSAAKDVSAAKGPLRDSGNTAERSSRRLAVECARGFPIGGAVAGWHWKTSLTKRKLVPTLMARTARRIPPSQPSPRIPPKQANDIGAMSWTWGTPAFGRLPTLPTVREICVRRRQEGRWGRTDTEVHTVARGPDDPPSMETAEETARSEIAAKTCLAFRIPVPSSP